VQGQLIARQLEHGGHTRSYLLYVPPRLADPAPVVLVLHGSAASGERMRRATAGAFDVLADAHAAIVVYPDGHLDHWNDCRTAGGNPARAAAVDDVGFLRALLARLDADPALQGGRVDSRQVFAFGLSNGGHMGLRLALEAPDLVAGVTAVAAALPVASNSGCAATGRAVPVLLINGDRDPISPYGGGTVTMLGPLGNRGDVQSALASAQYFQELAGHRSAPFEHRYPDDDPGDGTVAVRRVWTAPGRPEVALITIHGGGHTIPHPRKQFPRIFGRTSHDISAAAEAWRFFLRQAPVGATGN
jgi:polyhydroxybutyrate depolymerase